MLSLTNFLHIVNNDRFGEDIVYVADSVEYHIRAVVERNISTSYNRRFNRGSETKHLKNLVYIRIANDADYGVTEITPREDTVTIARYEGGSETVNGTVTDINHQDGVTWELVVSL
jgi:hypothetical protein